MRSLFACAASFQHDISRAARPSREPASFGLRSFSWFAYIVHVALKIGTVLKIGAAARVPFAGVAELVDARDLGSRVERRRGSNPFARTKSPAPTPGTPEGSLLPPI